MSKPISPVMKKHFKRLEADEAALRARIQTLYDLNLATIAGIVFAYLTDPAPAVVRISSQKARTLDATGLTRYGQLMSFDEIHRLTRAEALTLELESVQAAHARAAGVLISKHLTNEITMLAEDLEDYLCIPFVINGPVLRKLLEDPQYPMNRTLTESCVRVGKKAAQMILQQQAQGRDVTDITRDAESYMRKATNHVTDAVTYYEDTRTAVDLVFDFLDEAGEEFYKTRCVHDGKTCSTCLGMEAEQERRPVRLEERMTGVNCPPYHPWCRCWVEVVTA